MDHLRSTTPRARKQHSCDWCARDIRAGTRYRRHTFVDEGHLYCWKAHQGCERLVHPAIDYFDMCQHDGLTPDSWRDYIGDVEWSVLEAHLGDAPEADVERLRALWKQLRRELEHMKGEGGRPS